MKIDKNSWHYRLNDKVHGHLLSDEEHWTPPETLCRYFWSTIVSLAVLAVVTTLAAAMSSVAVIFVVTAVHNPVEFWTTIGICIAVGLVIVIISNTSGRRTRERARDNKTGLVHSFLKAKKRKVCPTIEYVER